jgi:hypothetical protein
MRRRKRRQTTPEHPRRALFCLTLDNKLRRTCIKLVEWKYVFRKKQNLLFFFMFILIDLLNILCCLQFFVIVQH